MRLPPPRSELYLRGDIQNILAAIDAGNAELTAAISTAQVAVYRAGFTAALRAVALAFDVEPPKTHPVVYIEARAEPRALPAGPSAFPGW